MTNSAPSPLTPADCDLQDFKFMPLDVGRLRDSDLASDETPEACWAAVLLWCASWHQVPAASIPDSDSWLAKQAGYAQRGKISKEWADVREGALRGWIKCSDGRLYHPVVAEKAIDAWNSKIDQRWRTECGRIKKHNDRHHLSLPRPSFDDWVSQGCPSGHRLPVPGDNGDMSTGTGQIVPRETPSKREGERQGQGQGQVLIQGIPDPDGSLPPAPLPTPVDGPELVLTGDEIPSIPACPLKQLVGMFSARLPELPKPRYELWKDGEGAEALRQRWKWLLSPEAVREDGSRYATTAAEGLAWFSRFFDNVAASDLLMGRKGAWRADLAWLMKRANFTKVVQGNYENRETQ